MTKMNWDRVNMENRDARAKEKILRDLEAAANVSRGMRRRRNSRKPSLAPRSRAQVVKKPAVVESRYRNPASTTSARSSREKKLQAGLDRVSALLQRVLEFFQSTSKTTPVTLGIPAPMLEEIESVKLPPPIDPITATGAKESIPPKVPQEGKKKRKRKKERAEVTVDIRYAGNTGPDAQRIATRMKRLGFDSRLLPVTHVRTNPKPKGTVECPFKTSKVESVVEMLVAELSDILELKPVHASRVRKGRMTFAIWL